jgi:hypothetical protein
LGLAALVAQIVVFRTVPLLAIAFNAFNVASIWLLHSLKNEQQNSATK